MAGFEGSHNEEISDKAKKTDQQDAKEKKEKSPGEELREFLIKKQGTYQEQINESKNIKEANQKVRSIQQEIINSLRSTDLIKNLKNGDKVIIDQYLTYAEVGAYQQFTLLILRDSYGDELITLGPGRL